MIEFNEIRYHAYRGVPDLMLPIAHGLGFYPSEETLDLQRRASGCIALIDATWDEDPKIRDSLMGYWSALVRGNKSHKPSFELLPQLVEDMTELHSIITPQQAYDFFVLGFRATRLARTYQNAERSRFVRLRRQEGRIAGNMMMTVMPDAVKSQPGFDAFAKIFGHLIAIGNVVDSAVDLKADNAAGETGVDPTTINALRMIWSILPETGQTFASLSPKTTFTFWKNSMKEGRRLKRLKQAENDQESRTDQPNPENQDPSV